jgi:hypothetical protein
MKFSVVLIVIFALWISGCASIQNAIDKKNVSYQFDLENKTQKFYSDKLLCENTYFRGYSFFSGEKVYGDIYQQGPARDCMLSKGYKEP